jgi:DNA polymerase
MFIGEAPGKDEDLQGRPFVGRAGQLLTKIIESIGLKREDVYIANILKSRPPDNRNPQPDEIAACTPYLLKQIECIKPKVICTLGKFSSQTLLDTEMPISSLRGKFYEYHGIKLMPTYHPAYLLRSSIGKKDVWEDMKKIAKELGLTIPKKKK